MIVLLFKIMNSVFFEQQKRQIYAEACALHNIGLRPRRMLPYGNIKLIIHSDVV